MSDFLDQWDCWLEWLDRGGRDRARPADEPSEPYDSEPSRGPGGPILHEDPSER